ncbi:MAG: SUMF1/EgtB/PvdO family nonheme iron enzyme [Rhodospirillales bacterium]|nr:SUMF1/EgtB/PvdO family nonheme iron enzyme [Rhodospirillales bacterium]
MNGVWEWVEDVWHGDYKGAPEDGSAWTAGGDPSDRVVRGGAFSNHPRSLRSAHRERFDAGTRNERIGFRVAKTLSAPAAVWSAPRRNSNGMR